MEGDKAHHLGKVLRAQISQLYELSDGVQVRLGRVESVSRDSVEFVLLGEVSAPEPELKIRLLLSVVKFDAFEWAIEKATELGVSEIVPLSADRSEKSLVAAAEKRSERWRKILLEAAQQSRRVRIPVLHSIVSPKQAFSMSEDKFGLFLSERPGAPTFHSALQGVAATEAVLVIGPEGGWTDAEVASSQNAGFREASLGRLILRTETAVIAALASLSYALGNQ